MHKTATTAKFSRSAETFDRLPDSALIDLNTLRTLMGGKHRNTIYTWVKRGVFPKPVPLEGMRNCWRVGEVRKALGIAG